MEYAIELPDIRGVEVRGSVQEDDQLPAEAVDERTQEADGMVSGQVFPRSRSRSFLLRGAPPSAP